MDPHDADLVLAMQLQDQFDDEASSSNNKSNTISMPGSSKTPNRAPLSIIDPAWELTDPIPDVRALFIQYNDLFFWGRLAGVEVRWSPRMTSCAGICCYEGHGGLCSVRLSTPLLKLRPRKDLVETLLHEMIHAYLFVTDNNKDHDGHGPEFHKHMNRINAATGTKIGVYHTFHDEVAAYKQHWWRCDGPCQKRSPYFGYVKRSMNRAPSVNDIWWKDHERSCGGKYTKIKEPEGYKKKNTKGSNEPGKENDKNKKNTNMDIRVFVGSGNILGSSNSTGDAKKSHDNKDADNNERRHSNHDLLSMFYSSDSDDDTDPYSKYVENEKNQSDTSTNKTTHNGTMGNIDILSNWTCDSKSLEHDESEKENNASDHVIDMLMDRDKTDDRLKDKSQIIDIGEPGQACSSDTDNHFGPISDVQAMLRKVWGNKDVASMKSTLTNSNRGIWNVPRKKQVPATSSSADQVNDINKKRKSSDSLDDYFIKKPKTLPDAGVASSSNSFSNTCTDASNSKVNRTGVNDARPSTSSQNSNNILPQAGDSTADPFQTCPVCQLSVKASTINTHLDACLQT